MGKLAYETADGQFFLTEGERERQDANRIGDDEMKATTCHHKTLVKQLVGNQHWYKCADCPQKFKANEWDGKVTIVTSAEKEGECG